MTLVLDVYPGKLIFYFANFLPKVFITKIRPLEMASSH
jgi:hypothetical protein